jgi:REP element-mobilizing transposase RayT
MGYPRRIQKPNLTYHVYSACINRENFLDSTSTKDLFLDVIRMAQQKYEFKLHAFQIMNNHFHVIIRTMNSFDSISSIVQYIKSIFAKKLNKKLGRSGPLWNRRFNDSIIEYAKESAIYMMWVLWSIAYNPVRNGIISEREIFNEYSSIGFYTQKDYRSRLTIFPPDDFSSLGDSDSERITTFNLYLHIYQSRLMGIEYQRFFPARI